MFMRSFYAHRSQKRKMGNDLTVILALLESMLVKASHKMLMKLKPGHVTSSHVLAVYLLVFSPPPHKLKKILFFSTLEECGIKPILF